MRAFLAAISAALITAVGSTLIWSEYRNALIRSSAPELGLDPPDHGNTHNLVGKSWWSGRDH